jgi:hypothetical protein
MHTHAQKHQRSPRGKFGDTARAAAPTARGPWERGVDQRPRTNHAQYGTAPPIVQEIVSSPGEPLDAGTRAFMEPRLGHDFGEVRVHAGPRAMQAARSLNAVAYTVGRDIVLGRENVAPDTRQGRELIAHELAHVVQQGGSTPSEPGNLRPTRPDDAAEREAHSAAAAVARGRFFRPQARTGVTLARQPDGGAPTLTPAPAPVPAPAPAPRERRWVPAVPSQRERRWVPPQAPAVAGPGPGVAVRAPTAVIPDVSFLEPGTRIPPTQSVRVPIFVNDLPPDGSVTVDVEGSGGANGTAWVEGDATLAGSGSVDIRGGVQTTPGNAGNLRVRASVGDAVIGRSPGFTVAAFPTSMTFRFYNDIDEQRRLGLVVENRMSSDGSGSMSELDQVEFSERVDAQSRDNPPFTHPGALSATGRGTSGYLPGDRPYIDTHTYGRVDINTARLGFGSWNIVYGQLHLFNCRRTGVRDAIMDGSGFTITHTVWSSAQAPGWKHQTQKVGAAVTVEGRAARAGWGQAESSVHSHEPRRASM